MFTADAHCDTLYRLTKQKKALNECTVTPERMAAGNVGLQTYAIFVGEHGPAGTPYQDGKEMLAMSYNLGVDILRGKLPDVPPTKPTGVLSVEGGELFVGDLKKVGEFDDDSRIRMVALTWNWENEIGCPGCSGSDEGLKPFGKELIAEMDRRGIMCDVSHLNDAGFWDVMKYTKLPPVASHSNCRWLCDVSRNLTKDMAKAIIERDGYIGINFFGKFLRQEDPCVLDDVLRCFDELCELGGERCVGFGSDFDGIDRWPKELSNPADFPAFLDVLLKHGYTEAQVANFAGLNLWNKMKTAEAARKI